MHIVLFIVQFGSAAPKISMYAHLTRFSALSMKHFGGVSPQSNHSYCWSSAPLFLSCSSVFFSLRMGGWSRCMHSPYEYKLLGWMKLATDRLDGPSFTVTTTTRRVNLSGRAKELYCDSPPSLMPSSLLSPSGGQSSLFLFPGCKPTYTNKIIHRCLGSSKYIQFAEIVRKSLHFKLFWMFSKMHLAPAVVLQLLQSCYVSLCQIYNMDVIAYTWKRTGKPCF